MSRSNLFSQVIKIIIYFVRRKIILLNFSKITLPCITSPSGQIESLQRQCLQNDKNQMLIFLYLEDIQKIEREPRRFTYKMCFKNQPPNQLSKQTK